MAKLRHITISVPDPEKAAEFYVRVFGMRKLENTDSPIATGVYLSDGVVNLALIRYKTDEAAGRERGKGYVGVHHLGFWVDDLEETRCRIEEHGGTFFMALPAQKDTLYYEQKFRDPNGVIFDISQHGWIGASK